MTTFIVISITALIIYCWFKYQVNKIVWHEWPIDNKDMVEVVGESYYQNAIEKIVGEHSDKGAAVDCIASLVPENDNVHDPKAVRVDINDMTVGYLDKDDAKAFRRRLKKHELPERKTTCSACINGGYRLNTGEKASYGVCLKIAALD